MARRVSRRKEPSRDIHMLKEQTKVDAGIFDEKTMIFLSKFFNKGVIEKLDAPIARGKESDIYIAEPGSAAKRFEYVALKFFRVETSSFFKMENYIIGDPRFSKKITGGREKFGIVKMWCKKEFGNLELAHRAKVNAPVPIMFNGTILAMSFIGEGGEPARRLKDAELENPEKTLKCILDQIGRLYRVRLVHGDISEYNILIKGGEPYIIDFGQAVLTGHPNSGEFLKRDVHNILAYFRKRYGVEMDPDETLKRITGKS